MNEKAEISLIFTVSLRNFHLFKTVILLVLLFSFSERSKSWQGLQLNKAIGTGAGEACRTYVDKVNCGEAVCDPSAHQWPGIILVVDHSHPSSDTGMIVER